MVVVAVAVALPGRVCNLHAINNTCMVQPVTEHKVMAPAQRRKHPDVGMVAAVENKGSFASIERRQSLFQSVIERMVACQQTGR